MRFLIEKILGAVVHVPFLPYAINLDRWSQMDAPKWRYFRTYVDTPRSEIVDGVQVKYPHFRWTPLVRRTRRLD